MLNKKLDYIFVVLVLGLFVISACEQTVGKKINSKKIENNENRILADRPISICQASCTKNGEQEGYSINCDGKGCSCNCNDDPVCSCKGGAYTPTN